MEEEEVQAGLEGVVQSVGTSSSTSDVICLLLLSFLRPLAVAIQ